jgi:hypothetical protein
MDEDTCTCVTCKVSHIYKGRREDDDSAMFFSPLYTGLGLGLFSRDVLEPNQFPPTVELNSFNKSIGGRLLFDVRWNSLLSISHI